MPKIVINYLVHTNRDIKRRENKYNDSTVHTTKYHVKDIPVKPERVTKQGPNTKPQHYPLEQNIHV